MQAEEVEVVSCAPCVDLMPATCTVRPLAASQQLQYSHFGEIYKGRVLASRHVTDTMCVDHVRCGHEGGGGTPHQEHQDTRRYEG